MKDSYTFYISMGMSWPPTQQFLPPVVCQTVTCALTSEVSASPPGVLLVKFSGSAASGGVANNTQSLDLITEFKCQNVTKVHVLITIPLPGFLNVTFGFYKNCVLSKIPVDIGTTISRCCLEILLTFLRQA